MHANAISNRRDIFGGIMLGAQYSLRLSTEELCAAPRDVLAPPSELERHVLVALSGDTHGAASVRMIFITASIDPRLPTMRDVLWWLASDSWAVEQATYGYQRWAALYKYSEFDTAAPRLFEMHATQAKALATLLDESGYAKLLALYEDQLRAGRGDQNIENLVFETRE